MAAYAAVSSLQNTIYFLVYDSPHISIVPPALDILKSADEELCFLKQILEILNDSNSSSGKRRRERLTALDTQIQEAVYKLEDAIESHVSNQIAKQSDSCGDGIHFSVDLLGLRQEIHSFSEVWKKMGKECMNKLYILFPEEEEEDDDTDETLPDFGGTKSKMVGLSDQFNQTKDHLTGQPHPQLEIMCPEVRGIFYLVGMPGIGKTMLAWKIFEDPDILEFVNCLRVWVRVGRKYQLEEIRESFLAQLDPHMDKNLVEGDDEKIHEYLKESLKGKRCLVVLDDVWDPRVWMYLRSFLPYEVNESRFLVTTRLKYVACLEVLDMRFLNNEESWDLLREKVFGEESCPPQLEKFGKMIAENCEGLPLAIIKVANLLSKVEKTLDFWSKVAARKSHQLFIDAYHQMSKVLYPSYEYLSQNLRMCFLYMGVFPQSCKIPCSKLIYMLFAEGFFECSPRYSRNNVIVFLQHLVDDSIAMAYQKCSGLSYHVKTCGLHSSFWYFCVREAGKNKFFHVINSHRDCLAEYIESQKRLCMHNNVLFGIKDVYNSMENNCASTARSLLCLGPYNQYPVPIFCGLRLLRVLDALKIRFYKFPLEVLELVLLRYLALTYNGNLPASISKLWNLRFLIVGRHQRIKSFGALSYLPMEIWDMQELRHLQIMGTNPLRLPNPNWGPSLSKLLRLLDVSPRSCTKGILRRIPNLEKLGILIELTPDDDYKTFRCLNRIHHLRRLRSLKCVVMNPDLRSKFVRLSAPRSMIRSGVKKLHLSGLGYPWEYMTIIASMPNLQVLKLKHCAFQGPKWEVQVDGFLKLQDLLIEDTDLVQWRIGYGSFRWLAHLSIKHCYKLEEIHGKFCRQPDRIEVLDSNPLAVTCVKKMIEAKSREGCRVPDVDFSWDDGKVKII